MPGIELRFNHDQSTSIADFAITKNGKEIGALEVTRSTVQKGEELRSQIRKNRIIERKHCRSYWIIQLGNDARINSIKRYADQYLRDVEILEKKRVLLRNGLSH